MKKVLTLIFFIPLFAAAQKNEVITLDSTFTKADLYSKSLIWVAKIWKSANNVIQMKDAETGVIVVKGGMKSKPQVLALVIPAEGTTMTTLTLRVKDGKAKIEFEDTFYKWEEGQHWTTEDGGKHSGTFIKWRDACYAEQEKMTADYKTALSKKVDDF